MANNVNLIDPNSVNTNPNIINSIPQYQDMYIFAELTAVRKGRTVLEMMSENGGLNVVTTGLEDTKKVNFLGTNQNKENGNPNYLNFTTNYYDGSTGGKVQYEGFGMSNIKVVINSSFVPQINIQFVDIRGLAFFNQENSPYRIIFDFPPPIFNLTIKGYYGMALKYHLHLVKYTSEFKAENGNFVIDAQFIAVTYAPLTDVLLRYVTNFPLMDPNTQISLTPSPYTQPSCTYELILKLKNLYSAIAKFIKSSSETEKYDATLSELAKNTQSMSLLADYQGHLNDLGRAYLMMVNRTTTKPTSVNALMASSLFNTQTSSENEYDIVTPLGTLLDYDKVVMSAYPVKSFPTNPNQRLFISYAFGKVNKDADGNPLFIAVDTSNTNKCDTTLSEYRRKLLDINKSDENSILKPRTFSNPYNMAIKQNSSPSTKYIGIDVTEYYLQLFRKRNELKTQRAALTKTISTKINNMIIENLGMMPTIYNIFRIILNDVDKFFDKIRNTSIDAENKHNIPDYKKIILSGEYGDTTDKIFSFPLVYKTENVSGGKREVRIAPIEISKQLPEPFPEITLVNDFITTFFKQEQFNEQMNLKAKEDADGRIDWIPISPIDSLLASTNTSSPYFGVKNLTQVYQILLDRFYILTQNAIPSSFYGTNGDTSTKRLKSYIELYSTSEAANLVASVKNKELSDLLNESSKTFGDITEFYKFLNDPKNGITNYSDDTKDVIDTSDSNLPAYVDKTNPAYVGLALNDEGISSITVPDNSGKPIDKFLAKQKTKTFFEVIAFLKPAKASYGITKENVYYIDDDMPNSPYKDVSGIKLGTRFLGGGMTLTYNEDNPSKSVVSYDSGGRTEKRNRLESIEGLVADGNKYFKDMEALPANPVDLGSLSFSYITDSWIRELALYGDEIFADNAFLNDKDLRAVLYLSNFGETMSPFNEFPRYLNEFIFSVPAAVVVPEYLPLYMGALVGAKDGGTASLYNRLKTFFTAGGGKKINNSGLHIFADIADIENNLSVVDKQTFKFKYDTFKQGEYGGLLDNAKLLYDAAKAKAGANADLFERQDAYKFYLFDRDKKTENTGAYFSSLIIPLISRTNIINFSELTFQKSSGKVNFTSLKTLNDTSSTMKTVNDSFFSGFISEMRTLLATNNDKLKKEQEERDKTSGDEDIITQTYYSFKNINDKWISNPIDIKTTGFPFNPVGKNLIDSFAFVDRAMNPIGNTVINAEILGQMFEDPNLSVFSALSQLLSLNGFEFFPIQNFMTYIITNNDGTVRDNGNANWEKSFKIDVSNKVETQPAFVCMYIGGTASYPNNVGNGFKDDGIENFDSNPPVDFGTSADRNTYSEEDKSQTDGNPLFPWRRVRAFRVRFGEQNQSMFSDIKIDSKEYPETNESIQILARLAGDNKANAPIPKGQNLYNLYENRAYKATITGLGNAMIQPTQYFQLENVPLFNGAYIILTVEHTIEPNKMMTSFSGTKISRYPVPRVINPASIMGFEGGDSNDTSIANMSAADMTINFGDSSTVPDNAKYNSMYNFNIQ